MKNQYVGDIGDYGKYSLLRFLALQGTRIGVNWYLTDNDESTDGSFTDYLDQDAYKSLDPDVYTALQEIVQKHSREDKSVQMVQDMEIIPRACFFDEKLLSNKISPMERAWIRRTWFEQSRIALCDADLIFADPDNGVTYRKVARHKGSEKFALPEEIAQYYYDGKDVVFYCHRGRRTSQDWEQTKIKIKEYTCDARLFMLTFHRGIQRSYIFVVHPERADRYEALLSEFVSSSRWGTNRTFTREDMIETSINTTPDLCRRLAVLNYFQKAFITKKEKEIILRMMTNEQIDALIAASSTPQGKTFYSSFKKSGFTAPVIGTRYPKESKIIRNEDGTITIVPPAKG